VTSAEGARLGAEAAHRLALADQFQMAPGLLDTEIDRVERAYGFEFADDHRAFLQAAPRSTIRRRSTRPGAARRHLAQAPKMIPVYAHRYLPAGCGSYGHPVLSIYQTDIIIYGTDLAAHIDREFGGTRPSADVNRIPSRLVSFWGDFV
jgi:hypothetical protein